MYFLHPITISFNNFVIFLYFKTGVFFFFSVSVVVTNALISWQQFLFISTTLLFLGFNNGFFWVEVISSLSCNFCNFNIDFCNSFLGAGHKWVAEISFKNCVCFWYFNTASFSCVSGGQNTINFFQQLFVFPNSSTTASSAG